MSNAQTPATWGVAIDVPLAIAYLPFGKVEYIETPGADTSGFMTDSWYGSISQSILLPLEKLAGWRFLS
ncbi:MAG: hypothetical protein BWX90_00661 [bacterium ADurb.Bin132]|nr:MAG: hypothetical protein BWX90_00661 [bacterium ADurb.Bin132]